MKAMAKCLSLGCKIENSKLKDESIEVSTEDGIIKVPIDETSIDGCFDLMDKIKQDPIAKDATVKTTTVFDSQAIRLEDSLQKISAKKQESELKEELVDTVNENEELIEECKNKLSNCGCDEEEFDPECELLEDQRDALSEEGNLEEFEDDCDTINSNNLRIMELKKLLSIKEVNLTENFRKQKPEVQLKLDEIIRSASFSALYTYFTAYKSSTDCAYEYDTKKIMELLSLEFCDVVNGEIDFTNTDFYYQALKDMVYELYKSIPGEEYKED